MKAVFLGLAMGLTVLAFAQVPDVQVKADLGPTFRNEVQSGSDVHWYDPFGHYSTVALQFALEPGFRAYLAQRIERVRRDGDRSQIDESFVEDAGFWRAGKQYLPFGQQRIFRESVVAIRSDTDLFLREFPLSIAACDGGRGKQRGIVGRIGRSFGLSFAFGQHFGISATSLTQARDIDAPVPAGYRQVLGADAYRNVGAVVLRGEGALFRGGEHGEHDLNVLDLTASLEPSVTRSLTLGYSLASSPGRRSLRVEGRFLLTTNVWAEPWIRTRNGHVYDTGVTVRVRL